MPVLDAILTGLLLLGVPGYMTWTSLVRREKPTPPRTRRYIKTILLALTLDLILAAGWVSKGRAAALLGLSFPVSAGGLGGLGLAVVALLGLVGVSRFQLKSGKAPDAGAVALFPKTGSELALFIILAVVVGFSWEALFRGYLLWSLSPRIGEVAAILLAALAYAFAHGVKSVRQVAGSLIAALIFNSAYALTGNLWWLILIHSALPLLALSLTTADTMRSESFTASER